MRVENHRGIGARVLDAVELLLAWGSVALLLMLLIAICVQVVARYVLNRPTSWSEQLAQYAFVWMTLLGSAVVTREGAHLGVTLVQERLQGSAARALALVTGSASLLVLGFWVYAGVTQVQLTWDMTEAGLNVRLGWVYLSVPVSCSLTAVFVLEKVLRAVAGGSGRGGIQT